MFDFSQFSTAGGLRGSYHGQAVIKNSPKHVAVTADAIIKPTPIETAKAKIIANLLHLFVLQETGFFKTARISNRKNDWWY